MAEFSIWKRAREKFELLLDDDPGLRKVGRHGVKWMGEREEGAKQSESMEKMRGVGYAKWVGGALAAVPLLARFRTIFQKMQNMPL